MMMSGVSHQKLAGDIYRLLQEEKYAQAQELLPSFAQAVVESCNNSGREEEFLQAKEFLRSAIVAVKVRQVHYVAQLEDLGFQRAFLGQPERKISVDFSG